jgi:competence protein ComEA
MDSTADEAAAATESVTPPAAAVPESAAIVDPPISPRIDPRVDPRVDPPHRPAELVTTAAGALDEAASLGLRRGDRLVLVVAAVIGLVLAGVHWARLSGWGLKPIEIDRPAERVFDYRLDANSATWVEWMQLPGIGETLARRIIEDRESRGPFHTVEDIGRVKGIGPKTLDRLRPWLFVSPPDEAMRR